jgi:hypothetical protein
MIAGKPPFLADTPLAVAYKQVHEVPPLLSKKVPDVPPRLELIVAKCLKKSKAERYRTADELLRDLDGAHLDIAPPVPPPAASPEQRITDRRGGDRRYRPAPLAISRAYLTGIFALFALVLGAVAFLFFRPAAPGPEGLRWIRPAAVAGDSFLEAPSLEWKPERLFDGDPTTAWAFAGEGSKTDGELTLTFPRPLLLTGLALETGLGKSTGGVPDLAAPLGFPKAVSVEVDGRKPMRFNLGDSQAPQFLGLGWVMADKVTLRFSPAAGQPAAIREIRLLGLPYE